jgi:hypothetical protein
MSDKMSLFLVSAPSLGVPDTKQLNGSSCSLASSESSDKDTGTKVKKHKRSVICITVHLL